MTKSKKLVKLITKQYDLDRIAHKLRYVFVCITFIAIMVVFVSELKRVIEFNRDKDQAQLIEVVAERCTFSRSARWRPGEAFCYVRDGDYTRKYLGLDPKRFIQDSIKTGDRLIVYEFPDGSLENDLKITSSYVNLVLSAIGAILYISIFIHAFLNRKRQ
jgi:hypothetical protein